MEKFTKKWWELGTEDRRYSMIDGLRALATFLEDNPTIKCSSTYTMRVWGVEKKDLRELAYLAEHVEKKADEYSYTLSTKFSETVTLEYGNSRESVCERVQTGTKFVEAKEARIEVIEHKAEEAREEPIFEYKCPTLLS